MSEIKVNKITPRAACGTTQLGDSGDTFTVPSGATITNLGTATGFGGTGVVSWDTASIKTVDFTAVTGTGYFVDTATTGEVEVTLPLSPAAGDVVGVSDYAKNFNTANCILLRNGSNIGGGADDSTLTTEGLAVTLVYVDGTKGWIVTDSGLQSDVPGALFITATGGCIATIGDYKYHKFLSPNTFIVTCAGNAGGSNTVQSLVVAGGGGASDNASGAGGAGGLRNASCISVTATPYAIAVGGGGASAATPSGAPGTTPGVDSTFSTITSAGGGRGGIASPSVPIQAGVDGGSGGGGVGNGRNSAGGAGNTPAAPAPLGGPQGNPGGSTCAASPNAYLGGAGGGGHATAGETHTGPAATPNGPLSKGGNGGNGTDTTPSFPSPTGGATFAGGGGGGANNDAGGTQPGGVAGPGGGGAGGTGGSGGTAG